MIGWTTVEHRGDAVALARGVIKAGLAACAQVSGPITSVYRWKEAVEETEEFRVTLKFRASIETDLAAWIDEHHPYDTPQWVAVTADAVAEKYLNWAEGNST